jgi:hypothetical protein
MFENYKTARIIHSIIFAMHLKLQNISLACTRLAITGTHIINIIQYIFKIAKKKKIELCQ